MLRCDMGLLPHSMGLVLGRLALPGRFLAGLLGVVGRHVTKVGLGDTRVRRVSDVLRRRLRVAHTANLDCTSQAAEFKGIVVPTMCQNDSSLGVVLYGECLCLGPI